MTRKKKTTAQYSALTGIHRAIPIILFAFAVFTMFCFITQDIGALGHAISALFLGLFSHGAYAIPLLLALHAIFYSSDIAGKRVASRVIFSLIAITFISALSYSITYWDSGFTFNAVEFFRNGKNAVGGGLIGGTVGFCITQIVGKVGLVTIAAAILAIYVSYFFAGGQIGLKTVFRAIMHFILLILAKTEKAIKRVLRKMKNAKTEKVKRNTNMKSLELADDDYFDEDNGMEKVNIPALGIRITRTDTGVNSNTTLHDKLFHKSAVSKEEAEEMELREQREQMYTSAMADLTTEETQPTVTPRRRTATFDYDVWEYDGGAETDSYRTDANDTVKEAVNEEVDAQHDESADSVFTKDFDPFSMAMSEKLASKPSSRSLLKEKQGQTKITEDVSELTEAEIEREKRILEFERRKAAIISNHRPTPVNNDGEFKGTPKNVDFHERKDETVEATPKETEISSFTFNKSARTYEKPKAEPANYTSIGIGGEGDSFSTVVKKQPTTNNGYQTVTSSTASNNTTVGNYPYGNANNTPAGNTAFGTGNGTSPYGNNSPYKDQTIRQNASAPYEEEATTVILNKKADDSARSSYSGANDGNPRVYDKAETVTAKKEYTQNTAEPYNMDHSGDDNVLFTFTSGKNTDVNTKDPILTDREKSDKADNTFAVNNASSTEDKDSNQTVNNGYYTTDNSADETEQTEFVPEFKPYRAATDDDVSAKEVHVIRLDEGETENLGTIKIEREIITDDGPGDIYSGIDDEDDLYEGLDDEDDELDGDGELDGAEFEEDDSVFETAEIPVSERNPVVQGYKDMFTALHDENTDSKEETDTDADVTDALETDANFEDEDLDAENYADEDYSDEDDDIDSEPPFAHTRVVPDSKTASAKEPAETEVKTVKAKPDFSNYKFPPIDLLGLDPAVEDDKSEIQVNTNIMIETLASFGVTASIKGVDRGPRITRYEVVPARGVKVSAVTKLFNDLVLALGKKGVRMEAPIPGKSAIGFEIPNKHPQNVRLRELLESDEFRNPNSPTFIAVGKDVAGGAVFDDIRKYPHALVCGATGTGKSVCINAMLVSMLYHARPDELKLIMIDPKIVEFNMYSGIPHLLIPVITEAKQAAGALMWAVEEMERRYELLNKKNVRNIDSYNEKVKFDSSLGEPLPKIVIVIDELADLMLQVKDPVEDLIMKLAQKARAAGIHLLLGTQRPDTKVITGGIKANIPTRIACKVTSQIDSRTIFDEGGAEKLLGKGDMLYWPGDKGAAVRVQGAFVSESEVENIMAFLKSQSATDTYDDAIFEEINRKAQSCGKKSGGVEDSEEIGEAGSGYYSDPQFLDAVELAIRSRKISTSLLQRKLSIGYGKAAKYIDIMQDIGVVSEPNGQKPREVLITMDEWHEKLSRVSLS